MDDRRSALRDEQRGIRRAPIGSGARAGTRAAAPGLGYPPLHAGHATIEIVFLEDMSAIFCGSISVDVAGATGNPPLEPRHWIGAPGERGDLSGERAREGNKLTRWRVVEGRLVQVFDHRGGDARHEKNHFRRFSLSSSSRLSGLGAAAEESIADGPRHARHGPISDPQSVAGRQDHRVRSKGDGSRSEQGRTDCGPSDRRVGSQTAHDGSRERLEPTLVGGWKASFILSPHARARRRYGVFASMAARRSR